MELLVSIHPLDKDTPEIFGKIFQKEKKNKFR